MGGFGSGRKWGKATTSNRRALDIRLLHRDGSLVPGKAFYCYWYDDSSIGIRVEGDRVILKYENSDNGGEWQHVEYPVYVEWTPCNFGGRRAWLLCPACGRRVAILYSGRIFSCRHCQRLAYKCQRETDDDRAARRANRIRRRLGWKVGILNPRGGKPRGMRWNTFLRLVTQYDAFAEAALARLTRELRPRVT